MISFQFINKYVCQNKVQPSKYLIMLNLYKFVKLKVISILIERNVISEAPLAATGSLYFRQQMATVSRMRYSASKHVNDVISVQHLFIF